MASVNVATHNIIYNILYKMALQLCLTIIWLKKEQNVPYPSL